MKKMTNRIILNRIQTPDGTILTSYHRHDHKAHIDDNGQIYAVGGGLSDFKRVNHKDSFFSTPLVQLGFIKSIQAKELSVYSDAPFDVIRENLHWGVNYDKHMVRLPETKWTPICKLGTSHIKSILKNGYGSDWVKEYFKKELEFRKQ
jgi:capsule polysaccharide export protein KpsC/LpsZ